MKVFLKDSSVGLSQPQKGTWRRSVLTQIACGSHKRQVWGLRSVHWADRVVFQRVRYTSVPASCDDNFPKRFKGWLVLVVVAMTCYDNKIHLFGYKRFWAKMPKAEVFCRLLSPKKSQTLWPKCFTFPFQSCFHSFPSDPQPMSDGFQNPPDEEDPVILYTSGAGAPKANGHRNGWM